MDFKTIDLICGGWYLAVPDYQRDYEWTKVQNSTLAEDIFQMLYSSEGMHFTGAIVTVPFDASNATGCALNFADYGIETKGDTKIKHVVDGQQRLTSISVFLAALKDCAANDEQIANQHDVNIRSNLIASIDRILFGTNTNESLEPASCLILNGNTGNCYYTGILKAKQDKNYSKAYAGAKRLFEAHKLFSDEIALHKQDYLESNPSVTPIQYYLAIYKILTTKMKFVEIQCDGATNAFQVFDSLNGKGMDLTAADRIKNIVMSWAGPSVNKSSLWTQLETFVGLESMTSFFSAMLFVDKNKRVSKSRLPDEFKETNCSSGKTDFDSFFSLLLKKGEVYGQLINRKTGNLELDLLLNGIKTISVQAFVLIYAAAVLYKIDFVHPSQDFIQFIREILRLIVRFQVCEMATNKLDQFFGECIELMKNNENFQTIGEKIHSYTNLKVNDSLFEAEFATFAPDDAPTSEFYLANLENYFRVKLHNNREKISGSLTVEHIIPQTLSDDELKTWLGLDSLPQEVEGDRKRVLIERLANKVLLYGDDNSSAGKKAYLDKVAIYKNGKAGQDQGKPVSTFTLVEQLVDSYPDKYSLEQLQERAKKLAKAALQIW